MVASNKWRPSTASTRGGTALGGGTRCGRRCGIHRIDNGLVGRGNFHKPWASRSRSALAAVAMCKVPRGSRRARRRQTSVAKELP